MAIKRTCIPPAQTLPQAESYYGAEQTPLQHLICGFSRPWFGMGRAAVHFVNSRPSTTVANVGLGRPR
jgi:hypothetical protein